MNSPRPAFVLSVVSPVGDRADHLVTATDTSTWAELQPQLGVSGDAFIGARRLRADDRLTRLPHGSLVLPEPLPAPSGVLQLSCIEGPAIGARLPLTDRLRVIGRDPDLDLSIIDPDLSRRHCVVRVVSGRVEVRDLGSTNGSWVAEELLAPGVDRELRAGDRLRLGNCIFRLEQRRTPPPTTANYVAVQRRPHHADEPRLLEFRPPTAPRSPDRRAVPWLVTLLPLAVAGVLAWWMHNAMFLAFAIFSPVLMLAQYVSDHRSGRRSTAKERAAHEQALRAHHARVNRHLVDELHTRRRLFPPLTEAADAVELRTGDLWHRHPAAYGHLHWRVGAGTVASHVRAGAAESVDPDDTPEPLVGAPVTVDLTRHRLVGVTGPSNVRAAVLDSLLVQLAAWHSPSLISVAVLGSRVRERHPEIDWLPHVRPDARSASRIVDPHDELGIAALLAELGPASETDQPVRTMVVIDDARATGLPAFAGVLAAPGRYAATLICFTSTDTPLPALSRPVIELGSPVTARLDGARFVPDLPTPDLVRRALRSALPLVDAAPAGGTAPPPARVDLETVWRADRGDGLLSVADTVTRWSRAPYSTEVLLGATGSGPYAVDLRTDGPHALVAGTTGAGKSELLQTFVAALAAGNRPDELSFVLIDYKGGAAFAECARLPHTVGVVTDLDKHLTERALASLSAELRRREHLLATVGAKDLDDYRSRPDRPPVPRLVLVIDEFRVLAEELPDFITGLVRLATVGRSLGVHLVLATQRPAGVVTADIRANVNLRIALRVRDEGDSHDVVESAAAAGIRTDTPGRAYVRSGSGDLVAFQTGRVTLAPATERTLTVERPGAPPAPEPSGPTVLTELADVFGRAAAELGVAPAPSPWLPPLPSTVGADLDPSDSRAISGPTAEPFALLGRQDRPDEQSQPTFGWCPGVDQHLALIGGPRSGRTTALRRLLHDACTRRSPQQAQVHLLDFGRALTDLGEWPHVGSRLEPDEPGRLIRLAEHLTDVVAARQQTRAPEPALLLAIDGWEAFVETAEELVFGRVLDQVTALLRDGPSVGVHVVVTGGRALLTSRSLPLFRSQIVLRMSDPDDIAAAGIPRAAVPADLPPGRGLIAPSGIECQFALPADVAPSGDPAGVLGVPALPDRVSAADLQPWPGALTIGLGTAGPVGLPYGGRGDLVAVVAGPPGSGRTTALHLAAERLDDRPQAWVSGAAASAAPASAVRIDTAQQLTDWLAQNPAGVVLVDDAETVLGTDVEDVLADHALRAVHRGGVLLLGAAAIDLAGNYRELVAELRRRQTGVFLTPTQSEGDFLGLRFPTLDRPRPGAGFCCVRGTLTEVQVALPIRQ